MTLLAAMLSEATQNWTGHIERDFEVVAWFCALGLVLSFAALSQGIALS